MTERILLALLLGCALLRITAADAAAPQSVHAQYNLTIKGVPAAVMQESFEIRGDTYRIVSETRAIGLLALMQRRPGVVTSSGDVRPDGLRPKTFDGRRGGKDARRVHAEFDWTAGELKLEHDGHGETVILPVGTQDRLSAMYQFLFLTPEQLKNLSFPMTNGRKIDQYRYSIGPDTVIDTPLGRMAAIHLVKQHAENESATEIWLAREHHLMPVKMRIIEDDGDRFEQIIAQLEITP